MKRKLRNDNGQIVSSSENASFDEHAFLWQNGIMTDLGTLPEGSYSYAYGINDNGQIGALPLMHPALFMPFSGH